MFNASCLFSANYEAPENIIVNQGGSSSGKTYSIIQTLDTIACQERAVITVVGESIPNLKAGALRDQSDIINSSPILKSCITDYNKSDRILTFDTGSIIEFKSYLTAQDAKSGKRDYLFVNEGQGITWEIFNELYMRTRKRTWIDYNPNAEFWVHEKLIGKQGVKLIISDHRHNPFVAKNIRDKIEGLKEIDLELWKVYARGLTGKIEGLIFRNHHTVSEIPKEAEFIGAGMDFGFTNDPTTLIEVYRFNGELYLKELIYTTKLTNQDIANQLAALGYDKRKLIIADSAEPKSIEEIRRMGYNIQGATKGPDSIRIGIDILKRFKLNVTNDSLNLKKELMNYRWSEKDPSVPIDAFNHSIDAIRYLALNKLLTKNSGKYYFG